MKESFYDLGFFLLFIFGKGRYWQLGSFEIDFFWGVKVQLKLKKFILEGIVCS